MNIHELKIGDLYVYDLRLIIVPISIRSINKDRFAILVFNPKTKQLYNWTLHHLYNLLPIDAVL